MLDPDQFRALIVRPAITELELWSQAAENLLVGTALVESRLTHLRQLPDGPALGVFQMEPATHQDLWDNWLRYRPDLAAIMSGERARRASDANILIWNLRYAAMCCRLQYRRVPEPLPGAADVAGLARYWKSHWNTLRGRGEPQKFVSLYRRYGTAATG